MTGRTTRGVSLTAAVIIAIAACSGDGAVITTSSTTGPTVTTAAAGAPDGFSAPVRRAFMDGCTEEGNAAFCSCALAELEASMTEQEFIAMGFEMDEDGALPDPVIAAEAACSHLAAETAPASYSPRFRSDFLDGCIPEAGLAFCECALDEFAAMFTEEELGSIGLELDDTDDLPDDVLAVLSACYHLVDTEG